MAPKSSAAASFGASAGDILRDVMARTKSIIEGEDQKKAMSVDFPSTVKDSDMLSDGSFEKVEGITDITDANLNLAATVAMAHKNEEDSANLVLSGEPTKDYEFLGPATQMDVEKSLADLTEAMCRLATKDTTVDQGDGSRTGLAHSSAGEGSATEGLVLFEKLGSGHCRITNAAIDFPPVPGHIHSRLNDFILAGSKDLISILKTTGGIGEAAFHRILEAFPCLQHEQILSVEHARERPSPSLSALSARAPGSSKPRPVNAWAVDKKLTGLSLQADGLTWNLKAGGRGSVWMPILRKGVERPQDASAINAHWPSPSSAMPTWCRLTSRPWRPCRRVPSQYPTRTPGERPF